MRRTKLCKWAIRNTSFKWFHDVDDNGGEDGDYEHKDVNEIHIHRLLCTTWHIKEKFYFGRWIQNLYIKISNVLKNSPSGSFKSLCYKIMFNNTNELEYKQLKMFSHVLQMSPKATYPSTILRNQVTAAASSII